MTFDGKPFTLKIEQHKQPRSLSARQILASRRLFSNSSRILRFLDTRATVVRSLHDARDHPHSPHFRCLFTPYLLPLAHENIMNRAMRK